MLVNLSSRPQWGRNMALQPWNLNRQGLTPTQIGRKLGITKRRADLAVQYGKALELAGITDPYIELTSMPAKASHWGPRKKGRTSFGPENCLIMTENRGFLAGSQPLVCIAQTGTSRSRPRGYGASDLPGRRLGRR